MKYRLKILSTIILLFSVSIGLTYANNTDPKKLQEQEQRQPRKGNIDNQLVGQNTDQPQDGSQEIILDEDTAESTKEVSVDSVEDKSASKYNFIFYLLYKFKYEEDL